MSHYPKDAYKRRSDPRTHYLSLGGYAGEQCPTPDVKLGTRWNFRPYYVKRSPPPAPRFAGSYYDSLTRGGGPGPGYYKLDHAY